VLLLLLAVLALAGSSLLMSAFGAIDPQARREQRTLLLLAQARDALAGFAAVNGRLPLPAASSQDGLERAAPCASDADCTGYLPWATLGIDGLDAWGQRLRYSVTPALTTYAYAASTAVATRTVQTRDPEGQLRYLAGGATCSVQAQCAPFVVLSHGRRNFGVGETGIGRANTGVANDDEQTNAEATLHFISRPPTADPRQPGGEFDDLVAWLPLDLLYQRMRMARTLPN
jgi:type II secretory pathway pseudopilin PulG